MQAANDNLPLEAQVPQDVFATPKDVVIRDDEPLLWWRPGWRDVLQYVGWRWVFVLPATLVLAFFIAALFLAPLRPVLFAMGMQFSLFAFGLAAALGGYVIRRAVRARREPFCIFCGYNLSGLPDNYRCPECGRDYHWRLIDEYRKDPHWFVVRWKLQHGHPTTLVPIDAGPIPRKHRAKDGTE